MAPASLPRDARTGNYEEVAHEKPSADGGTDALSDVKPKSHDGYFDLHKQRSDFKRWGGRRTFEPDEPTQCTIA